MKTDINMDALVISTIIANFQRFYKDIKISNSHKVLLRARSPVRTGRWPPINIEGKPESAGSNPAGPAIFLVFFETICQSLKDIAVLLVVLKISVVHS